MRHIITLILVLFATVSFAANTVTLQWEPSPSPGVIGYAVCYDNELPADPTVCTNGEGSWAYVKDVGNVLEVTIDGLAPGTWTFAVVATDGLTTSVTSNRVQDVIEVVVLTPRVHEFYSTPEAPAQIRVIGPANISVE